MFKIYFVTDAHSIYCLHLDQIIIITYSENHISGQQKNVIIHQMQFYLISMLSLACLVNMEF